MDYKRKYDELINSRKLLTRKKKNDGLLESHHITPHCLGGVDDNVNLVLLTPREHYVAHWLLYKIYEGKDKARMAYAFFMMCRRNNNQKRLISSRQYHRAKEKMSATCTGKNHPRCGQKLWTDEQKQEISNRMKGKNNPRYGKSPWNKGLTKETDEILLNMSVNSKGKRVGFATGHRHTEETKQKISMGHKGKRLSDETKRKLSEINKGKCLSDETKRKMGDSSRGKLHKIVICPHCGKQGGTSAMKRWHFDNCKLKDYS